MPKIIIPITTPIKINKILIVNYRFIELYVLIVSTIPLINVNIPRTNII
ncbi:hypothetical protein SAMN04487910_1924 [Aquimarina amphilecti]|uniref:Uncharacterized protein n=1 Tax=Aquimarina amphilecti TaxID=1038014 RepID=A0A1H7N2I0_AQUAM|nr:hypothetical protein SAMN04487910_1924 [Aquimarina amphilecti]